MRWFKNVSTLLDSPVAKICNFFATLITIFSFLSSVGGIFVGLDLKGNEWGNRCPPLSALLLVLL
jgi:hypothetical protein